MLGFYLVTFDSFQDNFAEIEGFGSAKSAIYDAFEQFVQFSKKPDKRISWDRVVLQFVRRYGFEADPEWTQKYSGNLRRRSGRYIDDLMLLFWLYRKQQESRQHRDAFADACAGVMKEFPELHLEGLLDEPWPEYEWGVEHANPHTIDPPSYIVKMHDGGDVPNEPSNEVPVYLHALARVSDVVEHFKFGFNKVRVLLDLHHTRPVEIVMNIKYWGTEVHCKGAHAQLFGHGSTGFIELRMPTQDGSLDAQYDLFEKDEPIFWVRALDSHPNPPDVSAMLVGRIADMQVLDHPEDATLDQAKTALLCKMQEKATNDLKPNSDVGLTSVDMLLAYHKTKVHVSFAEPESES